MSTHSKSSEQTKKPQGNEKAPTLKKERKTNGDENKKTVTFAAET